jgi:hypothetical protein
VLGWRRRPYADRRAGPRGQSPDVIFLADVGLNELSLGAERTKLLDQLLADLIPSAGNGHLRALLGEGDGSGAPDAGESTGDQHNLRVHFTILCWPPETLRRFRPCVIAPSRDDHRCPIPARANDFFAEFDALRSTMH